MTRTQRDKVWTTVAKKIINQDPITTKEIREETGVSAKTIREVLNVAEEDGLLKRETEHSHEWQPIKLVQPDF